MALIIKGEMPTCCGGCKSVQRYRYSDECEYLEKPIARNGRLKDCPIIGEIPDEHGRLVDVDLLKGKVANVGDFGSQEMVAIRRILGEAEVVVEASK